MSRRPYGSVFPFVGMVFVVAVLAFVLIRFWP